MFTTYEQKFSGVFGAGASTITLGEGKLTIQKRTLDGKIVDRWELQPEKSSGYLFHNICSLSPDGQIAVVGKDVFDVPGGQCVASIAKGGATGIQTATEFSADSKWLAVSRNGKVTIFDTEQFESVYEVNGSGLLYVSFSEDGKRVVVAEGGKSGFVKLVSCGDWEVLFEGSETKVERTSVNLLKGGKEIYFGLEDNRMEVWNWKAME